MEDKKDIQKEKRKYSTPTITEIKIDKEKFLLLFSVIPVVNQLMVALQDTSILILLKMLNFNNYSKKF